jgi:hypothetical protein
MYNSLVGGRKYWGLNSGPHAARPSALPLESLCQPFFCVGYFRYRDSWTICLGWHQTMILLISASWVARITGVSHWHPASCITLDFDLQSIPYNESDSRVVMLWANSRTDQIAWVLVWNSLHYLSNSSEIPRQNLKWRVSFWVRTQKSFTHPRGIHSPAWRNKHIIQVTFSVWFPCIKYHFFLLQKVM